jgi:hypothetical protein
MIPDSWVPLATFAQRVRKSKQRANVVARQERILGPYGVQGAARDKLGQWWVHPSAKWPGDGRARVKKVIQMPRGKNTPG